MHGVAPSLRVGSREAGPRRVDGVDAVQAPILALAALSREVTGKVDGDPALTWLGPRWLDLQVHRVFEPLAEHKLEELHRRGSNIPAKLRRSVLKDVRAPGASNWEHQATRRWFDPPGAIP